MWLSGHSSVQQSRPDPFGAIDNNLNGLIKFKKIFKGRLIYASSEVCTVKFQVYVKKIPQ